MDIDNRKLIIGLGVVFLLGVAFAVTNGWWVETTQTQLPLVVYAIAFVSVLVGAGLVLLFQWRLSQHQLEGVLKLLQREERIVVHELLKHRGELEQNRLVVLTGLTKVQVFRVTARLAERGVVEKKPAGNTNLIVLTL